MNRILSGETEQDLNSVMENLEMVTDAGEMLVILTESKTNGTAVGICAPAVLGSETYVTAVVDIVIGVDIIIVLKNYDITGYILETNRLRLAEIRSVHPFKSPLGNPYMRSTRKHTRSL